MNYTVQELALQYAEAMVRFYQANDRYYSTARDDSVFSDVYDDFTAARDAMYDAQERLKEATKKQADMLNDR
jgi:hypothetical protein